MTPQTLETLAAENQRLQMALFAMVMEAKQRGCGLKIADDALSDENFKRVYGIERSARYEGLNPTEPAQYRISTADCPHMKDGLIPTGDGEITCKQCWKEYRARSNSYKPSPAPQPVTNEYPPIGKDVGAEIIDMQGVLHAHVRPTTEESSAVPFQLKKRSFSDMVKYYIGAVAVDGASSLLGHSCIVAAHEQQIESLTAERDALRSRADVSREELTFLLGWANDAVPSSYYAVLARLEEIRAKNTNPLAPAKENKL